MVTGNRYPETNGHGLVVTTGAPLYLSAGYMVDMPASALSEMVQRGICNDNKVMR